MTSDFMKGYKRSPDVTRSLLAALEAALTARPTERLGQLLVNLARDDDLWNVRDEQWCDRLIEAAWTSEGSA
jgi:hypothetical protein